MKYRKAKVSVLPLASLGDFVRERWSSRASVFLDRIETQSASGEELSPLIPSVLDKAFKGEL
jgi:hypothetical protein